MWEQSRACRTFTLKGVFNGFCSVKVRTVGPVPPTFVCLPDISGINDFQVLGQTEVSIQVGWKNPPAEVDYFRLTATDPSGQEEELSVQRSQEARTKHTILGQLCHTPSLLNIRIIGVCFVVTFKRQYTVVLQSYFLLLLIEIHLFCRSVSRNGLPDFGAGRQRSCGGKAVFCHWRHRSALTSWRCQHSGETHMYINQWLIFKFRNRSQELREFFGSHLGWLVGHMWR